MMGCERHKSYLDTASKSHSQSTVPQLRDWKTLNATTVLSESCTFTEIYRANKLAKNKSLTSEYKKTADKSAFFGSFSNFSANLIFCQRQTAVDFNFTGLIALQCLFSNDLSFSIRHLQYRNEYVFHIKNRTVSLS